MRVLEVITALPAAKLFGLTDQRRSDGDRDGKDSAVCHTACELLALECESTRLVLTRYTYKETGKPELPDLGNALR